MGVGCVFLAVGILICTNYNGLELLHDYEYTSTTIELELKDLDLNIHFTSEVNYDADVWPLLERLWVRERSYTCKEGLCQGDILDTPMQSTTTPPDTPMQSSTTTPSTSSSTMSDVGIILVVFGSVISTVLLYCLAVCMEWQRRCFSFIRRKYRRCRGIENENDSDGGGNRSALENFGREIRERMDNTTPSLSGVVDTSPIPPIPQRPQRKARYLRTPQSFPGQHQPHHLRSPQSFTVQHHSTPISSLHTVEEMSEGACALQEKSKDFEVVFTNRTVP